MKPATNLSCLLTALCLAVAPVAAQEAVRDGQWMVTHAEPDGRRVQTMELTLFPQAESKPALRYRLVPRPIDQHDGNAALFYLKAMGFFEQQPARRELFAFDERAREAAKAEGEGATAAPYRWLDMSPDELPVEEVREYLKLLEFQTDFIADAARRGEFSLDRDINKVKSPVAYLLPEIQQTRELARTQSLRFRLAIREQRIEDAIEILGQQFALAQHLCQDEFLVSNLVGFAISQIAWNDMLYLVQHPEAPNFYWSLAALPTFTISDAALDNELNLLYLEFPLLREVTTDPRTPGYWNWIAKELVQKFEYLLTSESWGADLADFGPPDGRVPGVAAMFASSYPAAKRYLIEDAHLERELVDSLVPAQVILLAVRHLYDERRDNFYKWYSLPPLQIASHYEYQELETQLRNVVEQNGLIAILPDIVLPAIRAVRISESRAQQGAELLRTVEAIRDHAATSGELPKRLEDLRLPLPLDPFTGNPLRYEHNGDHAALSIAAPHLETRLVLKLGSR